MQYHSISLNNDVLILVCKNNDIASSKPLNTLLYMRGYMQNMREYMPGYLRGYMLG